VRIKANGITLNVLDRGASVSTANRPALIFLHYFGGSSRTWTEVISRLSADYHCLAPDLRGFGESDSPTNGYAVKDYADDVAGLIAAANVENYVLVGHSMGGKIALILAACRPSNLHSLVLLATSPPTPEPIPDDERIRLLYAYGDPRATEETIGKIVTRPLSAAKFERTVEDCLRSSSAAWQAWLERGSREDISAEMERINVPVTIAAGGMDKSITEELLRREVMQRIAGVRLMVLPDAGHLLPLESPVETANLINQHCQQTT